MPCCFLYLNYKKIRLHDHKHVSHIVNKSSIALSFNFIDSVDLTNTIRIVSNTNPIGTNMESRRKSDSKKSSAEIAELRKELVAHMKYSKIKSRLTSSDVKKIAVLAEEFYDRNGVRPSVDNFSNWTRHLLMPSTQEVEAAACIFTRNW